MTGPGVRAQFRTSLYLAESNVVLNRGLTPSLTQDRASRVRSKHRSFDLGQETMEQPENPTKNEANERPSDSQDW